VPFRYIVFLIALLALFAINPPLIFFLVFFAYMLSGPVGALIRRGQRGAPPATPES
jgi:hypothetical protein